MNQVLSPKPPPPERSDLSRAVWQRFRDRDYVGAETLLRAVTDNGITLSGPAARIRLNTVAVHVDAVPITLNDSGGTCAAAARVGDPVTVTGASLPNGGPISATGVIGPIGSNTVCIGP